MKTFTSEFEVYFEDISPSGKIHLEKLAEWMSMAREQYFKANCPQHLKFAEGPIKMFTANIAITINNFSSQWADKIVVILTSSNIKKVSFEINAEFKDVRTGEIIARGLQKVTFVDIQNSKLVDIPNDLKSKIVQYQKSQNYIRND